MDKAVGIKPDAPKSTSDAKTETGRPRSRGGRGGRGRGGRGRGARGGRGGLSGEA